MADKTLLSQYDGTHVKVGDQLRRFDKGAVIPDAADKAHVKHLLELGMVAEGEPAGGATGVDPDAPPPFPLPDEADQPDKSRARRASSDKSRARRASSDKSRARRASSDKSRARRASSDKDDAKQ